MDDKKEDLVVWYAKIKGISKEAAEDELKRQQTAAMDKAVQNLFSKGTGPPGFKGGLQALLRDE